MLSGELGNENNEKTTIGPKGLFTWREEDPGTRKILEGGLSQRAICFLYSVYMQRVVLVPRARIFQVQGSSYLKDRKILTPCKLPSLGRS